MTFPKSLIIILSFAIPFYLTAQIQDDFSDGNFSDSPSWQGDVANFIVNPEFQLQLDAPEAGTSTLFLPTSIADSAVWEMFFKMDFSPSGSNSLHIVLQSDSSSLLDGNGYYLFIGETGSNDAIHFYRMDNGSTTLLASATTGAVASTPNIRIRMEREPSGVWTLLVDYTGGQNYIAELTITDDTYIGSNDLFFGIQCKYTATRTDKFFFDDILVEPLLPDLQAPVLLSANTISSTEIDVFFDEPLDESAAIEPTNYQINSGIGQPSAAFLDGMDKTLVHLSLQNPMTSLSNYILTTENISDLEGNTSGQQTTSFSFFEILNPIEFDILINEIMADPTPAVTIPPVEFIELYNRSNTAFNLEGYGFSSGSTPQIFPDYLLMPKSYVLVCDEEDIDSLSLYGEVIGLSNFPSLVNSSDELTFSDADGQTIHFINYSDDMYGDPQKEDGGWTLELINPLAPCKGTSNWRASTSLLGGTPGQPNSVLDETPDLQGPILLSAFSNTNQPNIIELLFDEGLDKTTAEAINNFSISNNVSINSAILLPPSNNMIRLQLDMPLTPSIIYEITLSDSIADCSGNLIKSNTTTVALPEPIEELDLVINEILFNPVAGSVDFIEVFNRSDKVLNVGDLVIGNLQEGIDTVVNEVKTNRLIFPNEYAVFTESPSDVKSVYETQNDEAFVANDLPSFNNDEGNITLFRGGTSGATVIDELNYNEAFHHPLLDNPDGVSLERLDPNALTQDPNNWHSASELVGYATPTYKNSQSISSTNTVDDFFEIPEKKLSPDGDGFQDFLLINYKTDGPGYTAQIKIHDLEGRLVKTLLNNELLATEGFLRWDGDTDRGVKARIGIYIMYAQIFRPDGTIKEFKETCVVAGKL